MNIFDREIVETKSTDKKKASSQIEASEIRDYHRVVPGSSVGQKYELALMGGLTAADLGDISYWDSLGSSDEERDASYKGDAVPMLRWMSAVGAPDWNAWRANGSKGKPPFKDIDYTSYYLIATNEIANIGFWDLSAHPELQYKLLSLVGIGKKLDHQWLNLPPRIKKSTLVEALILEVHPGINRMELGILKSKYSMDELIDLAYGVGKTDKEIEEIKKEVNGKA